MGKKAALILILLFLPLSAAADQGSVLLRRAVEKAQEAEGKKIGDYRLVDQDGKAFSLSQYSGSPLVVTFIFTTCPDICNSIVATLVPAIEALKKEMGDTFNAVVVGFDTEYDTPEMLKEFGNHHETDFRLVRFASGDKETIGRMVNDFGFYYERSEGGGFKHLGLVTVVDKGGMIHRQIYKTKIDKGDLAAPIKEILTGVAAERRGVTFLDQLKLLCLTYDPETGEYRLNYSYLLGVGLQAMVIFLVAAFFLKEDMKKGALWLLGRRSKAKENQ